MFRSDAEIFIAELDARLCQQNFLGGDNMSLVDVAIFPFIRQFAAVEPLWFEQRPYLALRQWLSGFLASELFLSVMDKYPIWTECDHSQ
jgi:glutathione S-transferase